MAGPPEPTGERVNSAVLATRLAVIVGVGSVGSQVARELANKHIGRLRLIDHDKLEAHNLHRHVLTSDYVGQNKAEGMRLYFSKEAPALKAEALPWRIDQNISDASLDGLLHDAHLIVIATDDRETQWRVARRALALDILAVVPGLYERKGGEVVVQLSPEFPCLFCRDGFRPVDQAIRGATSGNADILAIIQLASQLSLALLDESSEYQRLLAIRRGRSRPPQLFIHNDYALGQHTLRWRPHCPSCAVGPSPLRPDAVEAWEAAEGTRRGDERPATPVTTTPPESVGQPLTPEEIRRRVSFIGVGIALLIGFVVLISGGSGSHTATATAPRVPVETPAELEGKVRKVAEARIAQLSFMCIERYICQEVPEGHPLPLFINGMDENLRTYLEQQGYKDKWQDSAGGIDGHTIGPDTENGDSIHAYVAAAQDKDIPENEAHEGSIKSGMMYEEDGEHSSMNGKGINPWDIDVGPWTITWTLRNPTGQVVKRLEYTANIVECPNNGPETYCGKVTEYELAVSERGLSVEYGDEYAKTFYTPPAAFSGE